MKNKSWTPYVKLCIHYSLVLLLAGWITGGCSRPAIQMEDLRVTFISNLSSDPVFSWKAISSESGFVQNASQVIVSDNLQEINRNHGNIWDSEKQNSHNPLMMKYDGEKLLGGEQYFAKVRVWDKDDSPSPWSEACRFVIPLEYPADWQSKWITYDYHPEAALPVFRKPFGIQDSDEIDFARLYIAAPGYYEAYLNGKKIGKNVLDPGQTNYEDYTYYTAYNIDPEDLSEQNVLGMMLGNGWYNQHLVWTPDMSYGQPVFTCQLVIHYRNGEKETIPSDESWQWTAGPITFTNVYAGEYYDAWREVGDWSSAGEVSGDWQAALPAEDHPTGLFEQFAEPIRVMDSIAATKIVDRGDGTYIFDFGQNFAGWTRLKIEGSPGQEITLRHTEELDAEGNIDPITTGVRATYVIQTEKYICTGEGVEVWEPRFTYFGFRYVEVTGLTQAPDKDLLTGVVVYSSVPDAGTFQCSEENINKLHELSRWTLISNIHSIPTDCPHREKCGWTGDAHAMVHAMIYNFDSQRFFSKYMFDMRSSAREEKDELYFGESFHDRSIVAKPAGIPTMIVPGKRTSGVASPDWGTAMIQIPWYLYLYYGDRMILDNFYPDMKVWVDYIQSKKEDGVIPHGLGDWCPPGGNGMIDCPVPVSSTAFHILDVSIMKQVSALFDLAEDHAFYTEMLDQLKADFNRKFFDTEMFTYGSQTADAMALDIGIVPEQYKKQVAGSIVKNIDEEFDGFVNTGIFGLARIFQMLCENGYEEETYRLLSKKGKNSFAFMWDHFDATTLWEVLPCSDSYDEGVLTRCSHSHPMQAGFDAWFYSGIAGINPTTEEAGFKKIVFKPYLTRYLDSADASYESGFGTIKSAWQNLPGKFTWKIHIPENSTGQIFVPTYGYGGSLLLNGKTVEAVRHEADFSMIGDYSPGEYLVEMDYE